MKHNKILYSVCKSLMCVGFGQVLSSLFITYIENCKFGLVLFMATSSYKSMVLDK